MRRRVRVISTVRFKDSGRDDGSRDVSGVMDILVLGLGRGQGPGELSSLQNMGFCAVSGRHQVLEVRARVRGTGLCQGLGQMHRDCAYS